MAVVTRQREDTRFYEPVEVEPPDDFATAEDFLAYIREEVSQDETFDRENMAAALEDMQFFIGKQWDDTVERRRRRARKPVLTENYLPAFVGQITGNRRMNDVTVHVIPEHGGSRDEAKVREGALRNAQKNARSKIAFNKASETQIIAGLGNFQMTLVEAHDDVFSQDVKLSGFDDIGAVLWDRMIQDPTGYDARHVTVSERLPRKVFEKRFPDASPAEMMRNSALLAEAWVDSDTVRIAWFTRMRTRLRTVAMFNDGGIRYFDGALPMQALMQVAAYNGRPMIRYNVECPYAQTYLVSGTDLLEGPYDLPIDRVPVFRVPGWEITVDGRPHRWGVVRFLKDPQRYINYWRSVRAEKLLQTPRAKWLARKNAVEGLEKDYRESHMSDNALLMFNDDAAEPPQLMQPAQLEPAISEEADRNKQALKDISNLHEASLGMTSNEVSGKAIVARQRVGELGSVVFLDNENLAIEEFGRVFNQLMPYLYSGPRLLKILGPDDKAALQAINLVDDPSSVDITACKYSVALSVGPNQTTKRVEARESMETVFNSAPQLMQPMLDIWFEAFDFPGADKMAKRAKKLLPPGSLEPDEMTPEEQESQAQAAQVQQAQAELTMQAAQADVAEKQAATGEKLARTELLRQQAAAVPAKLEIDAMKAEADIRSKQFNDHLQAIQIAHEGEDNAEREDDGPT